MKRADVVIILGGGIDRQGKISQATKRRLDRFLKEKKEFPSQPILLSGRWSGLVKDTPKTTEAHAMRAYLIKAGIDPRRIYEETKSLDTIGNAVFTKTIIRGHKNWKKIILITSNWHLKRSLWIFQRVFGKSYQIYPLAVVSKDKYKNRAAYENYLLAIAKKILRKIKSNPRGMTRVLQEIHPFYSHSKYAQRLLQEILIKRKKLLFIDGN